MCGVDLEGEGLLLVLRMHPMARMQMPTDAKMAELQEACAEKHDLLTDVYCVFDGVKFYFEATEDLDEQCMYYNGWKCDHFVGNLFVCSLDGLIIASILWMRLVRFMTLPLPSWVDCMICSIKYTFGQVESAASILLFVQNQILSWSSLAKTSSVLVVLKQLFLAEQATSLRQAAEWGMRAIQGSFPRLKDGIHYKTNGEWRVFLQLLTLLYNYQTNMVGLNAITNTYIPLWGVNCRYNVAMPWNTLYYVNTIL
jgi:hypothetical protein